MTQTVELAPFSQTEYQDKAQNGFPVGCPTLDLSASWDPSGKSLLIYRPSDQIVTKIHQIGPPGQKPPEVQTVTWRPDGQFLAVGWSDGCVRLMGLENNKTAHHIKIGDSAKAQITHIGWASNSIVKPKPSEVTQGLEKGFTQDTSLGEDALPMDLPYNLAFLEIDTALPKISPLPAGSAGAGEDATVFTLRTGIEFLFQPLSKEEYNQVNVMITGTSDGKLQLNICDSFTIGSFPCPLHSTIPAQLIRHAAHRQVSTQALLLSDKLQDPNEVHLVPIDLPFITASPINLSLLTSKLTTLQKLLRYLKQTQYHMQVEWKNTRELPMRFLASVQEDLEKMESGPRGVVPALYHLAVTGHVYEPVREWLVDSLAERGHKRWDKAVLSGLENLRGLLHENFLPALDRFNVILSRLRGLALFFDNRDEIGFSVTQIGRLMDAIGSLSLIGHKILIHVMDELDGFRAFSSWLRFQIDRLASSSSATEELTEKEATMDTSRVLTYIEHYLTQSPLSVFFEQISEEDHDTAWAHIEDGTSLLDELDKQLDKHENNQLSMRALPQVEFLIDCLTKWANRMFNDIAEAQKQNVRFGESTTLSIGQPITHMDMRMCNEKDGVKILTTLASKEAKNRVDVFSIGIDISGGISRNQSPLRCRIGLGTRSLVDLKFLNDETLLILCSEQDDTFKVIRIPLRQDKLKYSPFELETLNEATSTSADEFDVFSFPKAPSLRPVRMDAYDKCNTRGTMPARVCLLESNRTVLRTFALPDV